MMNRLRAGFCVVPNPFNPKQVSRISLLPADVDVIAFWTRHPRPLTKYLDEMDGGGFRYCFLYTVVGYPRDIESKCPPLETTLRTFQELSARIGPRRVVWRYDPIVFTAKTPPEYHMRRFSEIAEKLSGYTSRVIISLMDEYRKAKPRMDALSEKGAPMIDCHSDEFTRLIRNLAGAAGERGMEITSCAENVHLSAHGIQPGKCIDDELIRDVFGIEVSHRKDPSQRKACRCVVSRDIGMYDSCLYGCPYCYATSSFEQAATNYREHNPASPSLLGWYEPGSDNDKK